MSNGSLINGNGVGAVLEISGETLEIEIRFNASPRALMDGLVDIANQGGRPWLTRPLLGGGEDQNKSAGRSSRFGLDIHVPS